MKEIKPLEDLEVTGVNIPFNNSISDDVAALEKKYLDTFWLLQSVVATIETNRKKGNILTLCKESDKRFDDMINGWRKKMEEI